MAKRMIRIVGACLAGVVVLFGVFWASGFMGY